MLCLLCGATSGRRRTLEVADVQARVRAHALPGPFAYPAALAHASEPRECAVCLTCLRCIGKRRARSMLPMDQFLMWLLAPGIVNMDMRLWKRMRHSLTSPGNHFGAMPRFRDLARHRSPAEAARAWWEANLCTRYFAHKATARIVRASM